MTGICRIAARALILACFFVPRPAQAQGTFLDRVGTIFDNIGQGLSVVGKKASDLIGPGLGLGEKETASFTQSRHFNERYPVSPTPMITIANEFGEIRVTTWPNPVVQVDADISVGAESAEAAEQLAEAIEVQVTSAEDHLEIRTRLPDARPQGGTVTMTVNYTVTIPADAGLLTANDWGDTLVRDIGGMVGVRSLYGLVDLRDVSGPVRVQTRGEFAVEAHGLAQGGTFELNGAHATFSDISGALNVRNFGGTVTVRDLAPDAQLDVVSESGDIQIHLPEEAAPDLVASALFGDIASDLPLGRNTQGQLTVARSPNVEAKQRVALRTSFGNIRIVRDGLESAPPAPLIEGTSPFKSVLTERRPVGEATELVIEAIAGDIRIEGQDENVMSGNATKFVRVQDMANAEAAIERLSVEVVEEEGRVTVRTKLLGDMSGLGCPAYRVDLDIRCPRTCPIRIRAEEGHTSVTGTGGTIHVEQTAGTVSVKHAKGEQVLRNAKGDVTVSESAGPLDITAVSGSVKLNDIFGKAHLVCDQGKIVMESVHADVEAQSRKGDVRIISLEGLQGSYDIRAEGGDISILLPTSADVTFDVTAENGAVYSAIPLNGAISQGLQEFRGRLNEGTHRIALRSKDGNIRIN
ncbi:MAG TPA: DUF4097 family beta strand repeat-containing protein [Candidatus Hydrogenedentes bacterium]|nr:DUF4097 family beta strand repeat-containing protein [Candidatus Hydrogenedentota bacterium]HPG68247.1 DUF4097 family beta strand repeat-containing protein [Candidatus Hydrogenedentota bacterium]